MFIYLEENNRSEILAFLSGIAALTWSLRSPCFYLQLHPCMCLCWLPRGLGIPSEIWAVLHDPSEEWAWQGTQSILQEGTEMSLRWLWEITILLLLVIFYDNCMHQTRWEEPTALSFLKEQRGFCCSQALLLLGNLPCSFLFQRQVNVQGVQSQFLVVNVQSLSLLDQWPFHCPGLYCTENKLSFHGRVNTNTAHTPKSDSHVLQRTEKLPCLNLKTSGRGGWDYLTFKIFYKYYVNQICSE